MSTDVFCSEKAFVNYAGIDPHPNNSSVGIYDRADELAIKRRRRNDLRKILSWLEPYWIELVAVVVESTYNRY